MLQEPRAIALERVCPSTGSPHRIVFRNLSFVVLQELRVVALKRVCTSTGSPHRIVFRNLSSAVLQELRAMALKGVHLSNKPTGCCPQSVFSTRFSLCCRSCGRWR